MAGPGLRRRLRDWLGSSIGNRFGAVLLALTLGFMVVTASGNFAYLLYLTHQSVAESLNEAVRDAGNDLDSSLKGIREDIRLLAENPTVVSAVLDARDQETYLYPLLSRFKPRNRTAERLCVADYRGRGLGCSMTGPQSAVPAQALASAIAANRAMAFLGGAANKPMLYLVQPIHYEGTGRAEGAVVAEYDLARLFLTAIGDAQRYTHIHLTGDGRDLYLAGVSQGTVHVDHVLAGDGIFAPLRLRLSLGVPESHFTAPTLKLIAAYSLLALTLMVAAIWAARRVVPPLIARLTAITAEANRVAAGGAQTFVAQTDGNDEISQLARAFATMTQRLREINLSLERQVEERTQALRTQEAFIHSIMDAVPGAIFQLRMRPDGRFDMPFVSEALREIYDVEPALAHDDVEALSRRIHPDDRAAHAASLRASAEQGTHWRQDYRVLRGDGATVWLHGNAVPQREADGSVLWHGIITDITEHKRAELALADSEAYTKALFEYSYIPLVIIDPASGTFVDCNAAAVATYRLGTRANVLGKTALDVSAPLQYDGMPSAQAAQAHIRAAREDGVRIFEWRHQRPDGEVWDAEVRLMAFRYGGKELLQFSLRDITEQKRSEAESWRKANFDPLTGLANRSLCLDRLTRAMAQARRSGHKVGLLFVDLDGFKEINDTLGHASGDELLIEVARRLGHCVREQDTVARFGGDEFVLVVNNLVGGDDPSRVAAEVVAQLRQPFSLRGALGRISGSVGIAVFPDHAVEVETLLDCADLALYRAKHAGKNRYTFYAQEAEAPE